MRTKQGANREHFRSLWSDPAGYRTNNLSSSCFHFPTLSLPWSSILHSSGLSRSSRLVQSEVFWQSEREAKQQQRSACEISMAALLELTDIFSNSKIIRSQTDRQNGCRPGQWWNCCSKLKPSWNTTSCRRLESLVFIRDSSSHSVTRKPCP